MSYKQNRGLSFVIVALVYLFAVAVGIATYCLLDLALWLKILLADVAATVATFIFSVIFKNASVYDPYWSVQPPVILLLVAMSESLTAIEIAFLIIVCYWGIRLTVNWAYTFHGLSFQDWRYTMLNEKTGAFYPIINFIGIHMVPTLVVYACIMPAVYVVKAPEINQNVWSALFLACSFAATTIQGIADVQMHKFRKNRQGQTFIRTGLWKYSRHPNYLGEITMWWGIALASIAALGWHWWLATGAILNTLLFLFVSIPMADKRQSRKEGFAEYYSQTRKLLPLKRFK